MFEPLFARLSDRYHLVAPDYPGFGHSDWPDPKTFAYTNDLGHPLLSSARRRNDGN
jgi:pimeloyl-ACP methyl ester carboxylesterase